MQNKDRRAFVADFNDLRFVMPIFFSKAPKRGLAGLLGRKKTMPQTEPVSQHQLTPEEIARLFDKSVPSKAACEPKKLQASEELDRDIMSSLRGALYRRG